MAIDSKLIVHDFGGRGRFRVGPHDLRVAHNGWVYYVVAGTWVSNLGLDVGAAIYTTWWGLWPGHPLSHRIRERLRPRPWNVAVFRVGDVVAFNSSPVRRVHLETLPLGTEPQARIAELALRAEAGEFEPDA